MQHNTIRIRRNDMRKMSDVLGQMKKLRPSRVAVLGAQRAGTTIAARIFQSELGLKYVDENDFDVHDESYFRKHLKDGNCVVQAPCMSHIAHTIGDSVLVVFLWRDPKDIQRSAERIGRVWDCRMECHNYGKLLTDIGDAADMARLRWNYWLKVQRPAISNYVEIPYESLSQHELFIAKPKRKNFEPRQWRNEK